MISKETAKKRGQIQCLTIEDLVPINHLVRDIDRAIDFNFIYEEVKDLYSEDKGRPSIDPVVLFKMIFVQYMFGIRSFRQTVKEIEVNMAYKWFVGLDMMESVPHFSTFGKNYVRRFKGTDIFERIFKRILQEAIDSGFVDTKAIFIDSTHIKANANRKKKIEVYVTRESKKYQRELENEIEKDRIEHEKDPFKDDDNKPDDEKKITKSTTDPDCGEFHKGEHSKMFAYSAHTVCDKNNFVIETEVTAANKHDSTVFDDVYNKVKEDFKDIEDVVVDAGYKTPWIAKQILDDNKNPIMPYKRPMTKKGYFKKYEYVYDEYYDCYICPNGEILNYATTNRNGYKEYISNSKTCEYCEQKELCTANKNFKKLVTRHVWEKYLDEVEHIRHTEHGKELYAKRSETIERIFGDAKEKHGMRYTQYRGLNKVKMQVLLTFACMNLKKLAKWKKNRDFFTSSFAHFKTFLSNFIKKLIPSSIF
jgi:transposase